MNLSGGIFSARTAMRWCLVALLTLLVVVGLPASSRINGASSGGFLYSDWLRRGDGAAIEIGSFSVRVNRPPLWADADRIADKLGDTVDALPLGHWVMEYYLEEDAAISPRILESAAAAGWDLARVAAEEASWLAFDGARRRGFVRNVEVDLQSELGGRFSQAGLNVLGALRETRSDAVAWQLRSYVGDGRSGGNAGLIYRRAINNDSALAGANIFADYETYQSEGYWRWSLGGEFRSAYIDFFANYYVPITDPRQVGDEITYTAGGWDLELNFHHARLPWLIGVTEYYKWEGEYGVEDDTGWRAGIRLEPRTFPLSFEVLYQDGEEGESVGGAVRFRYEFGEANTRGVPSATFRPQDWFFRPAEREYSQRITTALRAETGSAFRIVGINPRGGSFTIEDFRGRTDPITLTITDVGGVSLALQEADSDTARTVAYGSTLGFQLPFEPMTVKTGVNGTLTGVTVAWADGLDFGTMVISSTVRLEGLTAYLQEGVVTVSAFGDFALLYPPASGTVLGSILLGGENTDVGAALSLSVGNVVVASDGSSTAASVSIVITDGNAQIFMPGETEPVSLDCNSADLATGIGKNCELLPPRLFVNDGYADGENGLTVGIIDGTLITVRHIQTRTPFLSGGGNTPPTPATDAALATVSVSGGDGSAVLSANTANTSLTFDPATGELRLAADAFGTPPPPIEPFANPGTSTFVLTVISTQGTETATLILTVAVESYAVPPLSAAFVGGVGGVVNGANVAVNAFYNEDLTVAFVVPSGGDNSGNPPYTFNLNTDDTDVSLGGNSGASVAIILTAAQTVVSGGTPMNNYAISATFPITITVADAADAGRTPGITPDVELSLIISVRAIAYPPVSGDFSSTPSVTVSRSDEALAVITGAGGGRDTYSYSLIGGDAGFFELSVKADGADATLYFADRSLPATSRVYAAVVRINETRSGESGTATLSVTVNAPESLRIQIGANDPYNALANHEVEVSGGRLILTHLETATPNTDTAFANVSFTGGSGEAVLSRDGSGASLVFTPVDGNVNLAANAFTSGPNDATITLTIQAADDRIGSTITTEFTVLVVGERLQQFDADVRRLSGAISGAGTQSLPLLVRGDFDNAVDIAVVEVSGGVQPYTIASVAGSGLAADIASTNPVAATIALPQQTAANTPGDLYTITLQINDNNTDTRVQGGTPQINQTVYARVSEIDYPVFSVAQTIGSGVSVGAGTSGNRYITNRRNAALAEINATGGSGEYRYSVTPNDFEMDGNILRFAQSGGVRVLPSPGDYTATVATRFVRGVGGTETVVETETTNIYFRINAAPQLDAIVLPNRSFSHGLDIAVSGAANLVTVMIDLQDASSVGSSVPHIASLELNPENADLNLDALSGEVISFDTTNRRFSLNDAAVFYGGGAVAAETVIITATVTDPDDNGNTETATASIVVALTVDDVELEWGAVPDYNNLANHQLEVDGGRLTLTHLETVAPNAGTAFATVSVTGGSGDAVLSRRGSGNNLDFAFDVAEGIGEVNLASVPTGANDITATLTVRASDPNGGMTVDAEFTVYIIGEQLQTFAAGFTPLPFISEGNGNAGTPYLFTATFGQQTEIAEFAVDGGLEPYTIAITDSEGLSGTVDPADASRYTVAADGDITQDALLSIVFRVEDANTDGNVQGGTPDILATLHARATDIVYPAVSVEMLIPLPGLAQNEGGGDGINTPFGPFTRSDFFLAGIIPGGGGGGPFEYELINGSEDVFDILDLKTTASPSERVNVFFADRRLPTTSGTYIATVRLTDTVSRLSHNAVVMFLVDAPTPEVISWIPDGVYPNYPNHDLSLEGNRLTLTYLETTSPNTGAFALLRLNRGTSPSAFPVVWTRINGGGTTLVLSGGTGTVRTLRLADGVFGTGVADATVTLTVQTAVTHIGSTLTTEFTVRIIGEALDPFAAEVDVLGGFSGGGELPSDPILVTGDFTAPVDVAVVEVSGGLPDYTIAEEGSGGLDVDIASAAPVAATIALPQQTTADSAGDLYTVTLRIGDSNADTNVQSGTPDILQSVHIRVSEIDYPDLGATFAAAENPPILTGSGTQSVPFSTNRRLADLAEITPTGGNGSGSYRYSVSPANVFTMDDNILRFATDSTSGERVLPSAGSHTAEVTVSSVDGGGTEIDTHTLTIYFSITPEIVLSGELAVRSAFDPGALRIRPTKDAGGLDIITAAIDIGSLSDFATNAPDPAAAASGFAEWTFSGNTADDRTIDFQIAAGEVVGLGTGANAGNIYLNRDHSFYASGNAGDSRTVAITATVAIPDSATLAVTGTIAVALFEGLALDLSPLDDVVDTGASPPVYRMTLGNRENLFRATAQNGAPPYTFTLHYDSTDTACETQAPYTLTREAAGDSAVLAFADSYTENPSGTNPYSCTDLRIEVTDDDGESESFGPFATEVYDVLELAVELLTGGANPAGERVRGGGTSADDPFSVPFNYSNFLNVADLTAEGGSGGGYQFSEEVDSPHFQLGRTNNERVVIREQNLTGTHRLTVRGTDSGGGLAFLTLYFAFAPPPVSIGFRDFVPGAGTEGDRFRPPRPYTVGAAFIILSGAGGTGTGFTFAQPAEDTGNRNPNFNVVSDNGRVESTGAGINGLQTLTVLATDDGGNSGMRVFYFDFGYPDLEVVPTAAGSTTGGTGVSVDPYIVRHDYSPNDAVATITPDGGSGTGYTYGQPTADTNNDFAVNANSGGATGQIVVVNAGVRGDQTVSVAVTDDANNAHTLAVHFEFQYPPVLVSVAGTTDIIRGGNGDSVSSPYDVNRGYAPGAVLATVAAEGGDGGPYAFSQQLGNVNRNLGIDIGRGEITAAVDLTGEQGMTVRVQDDAFNFGLLTLYFDFGQASLTARASPEAAVSGGAGTSETPYTVQYNYAAGALLAIVAAEGGDLSGTYTYEQAGSGNSAFEVNVHGEVIVLNPGITEAQIVSVLVEDGTNAYTLTLHFAFEDAPQWSAVPRAGSSAGVTGSGAENDPFIIPATTDITLDLVAADGLNYNYERIGSGTNLAVRPGAQREIRISRFQGLPRQELEVRVRSGNTGTTAVATITLYFVGQFALDISPQGGIGNGNRDGSAANPYGNVVRADTDLVRYRPTGNNQAAGEFTPMNGSEAIFVVEDIPSTNNANERALRFANTRTITGGEISGGTQEVRILPESGLYTVTILAQVTMVFSGQNDINLQGALTTMVHVFNVVRPAAELDARFAANAEYRPDGVGRAVATGTESRNLRVSYPGAPPTTPPIAAVQTSGGSGDVRISDIDVQSTGLQTNGNNLMLGAGALADGEISVKVYDARTADEASFNLTVGFANIGVEINSDINPSDSSGIPDSPVGPVRRADVALATITGAGGDGAGYNYTLEGANANEFTLSVSADRATAVLYFRELVTIGAETPNPVTVRVLPSSGVYTASVRVREPDHDVFADVAFDLMVDNSAGEPVFTELQVNQDYPPDLIFGTFSLGPLSGHQITYSAASQPRNEPHIYSVVVSNGGVAHIHPVNIAGLRGSADGLLFVDGANIADVTFGAISVRAYNPRTGRVATSPNNVNVQIVAGTVPLSVVVSRGEGIGGEGTSDSRYFVPRTYTANAVLASVRAGGGAGVPYAFSQPSTAENPNLFVDTNTGVITAAVNLTGAMIMTVRTTDKDTTNTLDEELHFFFQERFRAASSPVGRVSGTGLAVGTPYLVQHGYAADTELARVSAILGAEGATYTFAQFNGVNTDLFVDANSGAITAAVNLVGAREMTVRVTDADTGQFSDLPLFFQFSALGLQVMRAQGLSDLSGDGFSPDQRIIIPNLPPINFVLATLQGTGGIGAGTYSYAWVGTRPSAFNLGGTDGVISIRSNQTTGRNYDVTVRVSYGGSSATVRLYFAGTFGIQENFGQNTDRGDGITTPVGPISRADTDDALWRFSSVFSETGARGAFTLLDDDDNADNNLFTLSVSADDRNAGIRFAALTMVTLANGVLTELTVLPPTGVYRATVSMRALNAASDVHQAGAITTAVRSLRVENSGVPGAQYELNPEYAVPGAGGDVSLPQVTVLRIAYPEGSPPPTTPFVAQLAATGGEGVGISPVDTGNANLRLANGELFVDLGGADAPADGAFTVQVYNTRTGAVRDITLSVDFEAVEQLNFAYAANSEIDGDGGDGSEASPFGPVARADMSLAVVTPSGGDDAGYTYELINGSQDIFTVEAAADGANATLSFGGDDGVSTFTGSAIANPAVVTVLPPTGVHIATIRVEEPTESVFSFAEVAVRTQHPDALSITFALNSAHPANLALSVSVQIVRVESIGFANTTSIFIISADPFDAAAVNAHALSIEVSGGSGNAVVHYLQNHINLPRLQAVAGSPLYVINPDAANGSGFINAGVHDPRTGAALTTGWDMSVRIRRPLTLPVPDPAPGTGILQDTFNGNPRYRVPEGLAGGMNVLVLAAQGGAGGYQYSVSCTDSSGGSALVFAVSLGHLIRTLAGAGEYDCTVTVNSGGESDSLQIRVLIDAAPSSSVLGTTDRITGGAGTSADSAYSVSIDYPANAVLATVAGADGSESYVFSQPAVSTGDNNANFGIDETTGEISVLNTDLHLQGPQVLTVLVVDTAGTAAPELVLHFDFQEPVDPPRPAVAIGAGADSGTGTSLDPFVVPSTYTGAVPLAILSAEGGSGTYTFDQVQGGNRRPDIFINGADIYGQGLAGLGEIIVSVVATDSANADNTATLEVYFDFQAAVDSVDAVFAANAAINTGNGDGESETSAFGPVSRADMSLAVITGTGGTPAAGTGYEYTLINNAAPDEDTPPRFTLDIADDGAEATLYFGQYERGTGNFVHLLPENDDVYTATISVHESVADDFAQIEIVFTVEAPAFAEAVFVLNPALDGDSNGVHTIGSDLNGYSRIALANNGEELRVDYIAGSLPPETPYLASVEISGGSSELQLVEIVADDTGLSSGTGNEIAHVFADRDTINDLGRANLDSAVDVDTFDPQTGIEETVGLEVVFTEFAALNNVGASPNAAAGVSGAGTSGDRLSVPPGYAATDLLATAVGTGGIGDLTFRQEVGNENDDFVLAANGEIRADAGLTGDHSFFAEAVDSAGNVLASEILFNFQAAVESSAGAVTEAGVSGGGLVSGDPFVVDAGYDADETLVTVTATGGTETGYAFSQPDANTNAGLFVNADGEITAAVDLTGEQTMTVLVEDSAGVAAPELVLYFDFVDPPRPAVARAAGATGGTGTATNPFVVPSTYTGAVPLAILSAEGGGGTYTFDQVPDSQNRDFFIVVNEQIWANRDLPAGEEIVSVRVTDTAAPDNTATLIVYFDLQAAVESSAGAVTEAGVSGGGLASGDPFVVAGYDADETLVTVTATGGSRSGYDFAQPTGANNNPSLFVNADGEITAAVDLIGEQTMTVLALDSAGLAAPELVLYFDFQLPLRLITEAGEGVAAGEFLGASLYTMTPDNTGVVLRLVASGGTGVYPSFAVSDEAAEYNCADEFQVNTQGEVRINSAAVDALRTLAAGAGRIDRTCLFTTTDDGGESFTTPGVLIDFVPSPSSSASAVSPASGTGGTSSATAFSVPNAYSANDVLADADAAGGIGGHTFEQPTGNNANDNFAVNSANGEITVVNPDLTGEQILTVLVEDEEGNAAPELVLYFDFQEAVDPPRPAVAIGAGATRGTGTSLDPFVVPSTYTGAVPLAVLSAEGGSGTYTFDQVQGGNRRPDIFINGADIYGQGLAGAGEIIVSVVATDSANADNTATLIVYFDFQAAVESSAGAVSEAGVSGGGLDSGDPFVVAGYDADETLVTVTATGGSRTGYTYEQPTGANNNPSLFIDETSGAITAAVDLIGEQTMTVLAEDSEGVAAEELVLYFNFQAPPAHAAPVTPNPEVIEEGGEGTSAAPFVVKPGYAGNALLASVGCVRVSCFYSLVESPPALFLNTGNGQINVRVLNATGIQIIRLQLIDSINFETASVTLHFNFGTPAPDPVGSAVAVNGDINPGSGDGESETTAFGAVSRSDLSLAVITGIGGTPAAAGGGYTYSLMNNAAPDEDTPPRFTLEIADDGAEATLYFGRRERGDGTFVHFLPQSGVYTATISVHESAADEGAERKIVFAVDAPPPMRVDFAVNDGYNTAHNNVLVSVFAHGGVFFEYIANAEFLPEPPLPETPHAAVLEVSGGSGAAEIGDIPTAAAAAFGTRAERVGPAAFNFFISRAAFPPEDTGAEVPVYDPRTGVEMSLFARWTYNPVSAPSSSVSGTTDDITGGGDGTSSDLAFEVSSRYAANAVLATVEGADGFGAHTFSQPAQSTSNENTNFSVNAENGEITVITPDLTGEQILTVLAQDSKGNAAPELVLYFDFQLPLSLRTEAGEGVAASELGGLPLYTMTPDNTGVVLRLVASGGTGTYPSFAVSDAAAEYNCADEFQANAQGEVRINSAAVDALRTLAAGAGTSDRTCLFTTTDDGGESFTTTGVVIDFVPTPSSSASAVLPATGTGGTSSATAFSVPNTYSANDVLADADAAGGIGAHTFSQPAAGSGNENTNFSINAENGEITVVNPGLTGEEILTVLVEDEAGNAAAELVLYFDFAEAQSQEFQITGIEIVGADITETTSADGLRQFNFSSNSQNADGAVRVTAAGGSGIYTFRNSCTKVGTFSGANQPFARTGDETTTGEYRISPSLALQLFQASSAVEYNCEFRVRQHSASPPVGSNIIPVGDSNAIASEMVIIHITHLELPQPQPPSSSASAVSPATGTGGTSSATAFSVPPTYSANDVLADADAAGGIGGHTFSQPAAGSGNNNAHFSINAENGEITVITPNLTGEQILTVLVEDGEGDAAPDLILYFDFQLPLRGRLEAEGAGILDQGTVDGLRQFTVDRSNRDHRLWFRLEGGTDSGSWSIPTCSADIFNTQHTQAANPGGYQIRGQAPDGTHTCTLRGSSGSENVDIQVRIIVQNTPVPTGGGGAARAAGAGDGNLGGGGTRR